MSDIPQEYRQVFIQQRLFNYGAIALSAIGLGLTWLLIQLDVAAGWMCALTFVGFYLITIMGSRVRTNPLIRCTIENADPRLYGNLWLWSLVASILSISAYILASVLIWKFVPAIAIELKLFVVMICVQTSLMIAGSVE